jgi:hypothetical protein
VTPLPRYFRARTRWIDFVRWVLIAPIAAIFGAAAGGATLAVVCGVLPVVYALFVVRRVGVEATSGGLVMHDYFFKSRRVRWEDVVRVELSERWPWGALVVTNSGARIKALGLGASNIRHRESMEQSRNKVGELNQIRSDVLAQG